MVARWGVLWSPLTFSLEMCINIVQAVVRMHNFCTDISIATSKRFQREAVAGMNVRFAEPSDNDVQGEALADARMINVPDTDDIVFSLEMSGTSQVRERILLLAFQLDVQRPENTRVRSSDYML